VIERKIRKQSVRQSGHRAKSALDFGAGTKLPKN